LSFHIAKLGSSWPTFSDRTLCDLPTNQDNHQNQFVLDQPEQELLPAVTNSGLSLKRSIAMNIPPRLFGPADKTLLGIQRFPCRLNMVINSWYSTPLARGGLLTLMEKFFTK
jgi:hypothetical protein